MNRAAQAEALGMVCAVAMGYLVGALLISVDPYLSITPEMLSRTKPSLADLAVAVLAGLAGAYALIDEKISPALPGVAIATAIVPPLANSGICLAFGAYSGALGSFLLFFTNFISILLVSSLLFYRAGMHRVTGAQSTVRIVRKFGLAAMSFLVMVLVLAHSLVGIVREQVLEHEIKTRVTVALASENVSGIDKLYTNIRDGEVHAMAEIYAPVNVDPDAVHKLEEQLAGKLGMPVNLIIREIITNVVSSKGSNVSAVDHTLDGFFVDKKVRPEVMALQTARQTIKKYLQNHTDLHFVSADAFDLGGKPVILAKIAGFRRLGPKEIALIQDEIRTEVAQPRLELIFRFENVALYASQGPILPGWETTIPPDPARQAVMDTLVKSLEAAFAGNAHYLLETTHRVIEEDGYVILASVGATGAFEKEYLAELQKRLQAQADKPVTLYAWINQGPVVTDKGLVSFLDLSQARKGKSNPDDMKLIQKALERVR